MTAMMMLFVLIAVSATEGVRRAASPAAPLAARDSTPAASPPAESARTAASGSDEGESRGIDHQWGLALREFLQRQLSARVREFSVQVTGRARGGSISMLVAGEGSLSDADRWRIETERASRWLSNVLRRNPRQARNAAGCELGLVPRAVTVEAFGPRTSREKVVDAADTLHEAIERANATAPRRRPESETTYSSARRARVELTVSFELDEAQRRMLDRRFKQGPLTGQDSEGIVCR